MASFKEIIQSSGEELLQLLYKFERGNDDKDKVSSIAEKLKLRPVQLICSVGFNRFVRDLTEIPPILGYEDFDALAKIRNEHFINDIYKRLTLDNVLNIYTTVKDDADNQQIMQYLLHNRLATIEKRIEETVNSLIIDKYKEEMRAIYSDGVADIDFAEERLNKMDSGFRALVNEVTLITECKIIPAGDIFFRNSIMPEEKRKLLNKGLIPRELVQSRLDDESLSDPEKRMLADYLKLNREQ